jgi:hypothetical protein
MTVQLLERIRAEYLEMPGLRLTLAQVQRLCGVERTICQDLLNTLVDTKFLCVKPDGAYARVTDGADVRSPQPAKAALRPESAMRVEHRVATGRSGVR